MVPSGGEEREDAVVDREGVHRLVGEKVIVGINRPEAGGVEIVATLKEVRDDGVILSEVVDIGPGPTIFCPWETFRRDHDLPPWFEPPLDGPEDRELYQVREIPVHAPPPPELPPQRLEPSARTLQRIVPVAQKQTVGGITVALTSLELHGEGLGSLGWRISFEEDLYSEGGRGVPEPEFVLRDGAGRELPWSPRSSGSGGREADGEIEVEDLPESGEIEAEVSRLVFREFSPERGAEEETDSYEGPWPFRFSV
jgi:hypothetical protein